MGEFSYDEVKKLLESYGETTDDEIILAEQKDVNAFLGSGLAEQYYDNLEKEGWQGLPYAPNGIQKRAVVLLDMKKKGYHVPKVILVTARKTRQEFDEVIRLFKYVIEGDWSIKQAYASCPKKISYEDFRQGLFEYWETIIRG